MTSKLAKKNGHDKEAQELEDLLTLPGMYSIDKEGLDSTAQLIGYYRIYADMSRRKFDNLALKYAELLQAHTQLQDAYQSLQTSVTKVE